MEERKTILKELPRSSYIFSINISGTIIRQNGI